MKEIKGEKAGAGKQKKPVIAPDSAQSKTYIKQQIGLGEGEVEGLPNGNQSILLNETPVEDANGNQNFEGLTVDFRTGSNDQTYMEGFPEVSNETEIQVELKTQWVQSFSDINIDAIRVRLKFGALTKTNANNGNVDGITIKYAIDLSTDGGTYVEILNTQISDKTSNGYERTHRIDLSTASSGWNIRVRRLTPVSTDPYVTDDMYVASYAEVVDAKFRYPNTALLGLQYDAENFSGVAKVAVELKGLKIRVPSNYDPVTRTYSGVWDGSFKRAYSNNPAWIYYDICTAERYGLGNRITDAMLDKASLYRLGQYCDGQVSDGAGGLEPRFTCNVYIQKTEEAYAILSKIAGVFRAISYWDGDSIICDADIPQDVFYNYTNANVIGGLFEYSGTRARDRPSVVKVAWDNPANNYKTEYEIVRDESAIAKFGIRSHDLEAWGCTSRGQAQRAGIWALRAETQSVSFKVGLDGQIPVPGKVVSVADNDFAGRFIGGRISSISSDRKTLTLDREIQAIPGDSIYVNSEQGQAVTKTIASVSGKTVTVTMAYTNNQVAAQNAFTIDSTTLKTRKFRVMTVKQDDVHQFSITALEYNSSKFDAIDSGAYIEESPVSIINPKLQDPVTNVELSTYDQVQQGINIATMIITWTRAQFATKYLVEWRKDDGSWIKMPITGKTSVEVVGVYAGNYQARVTATSAFDISSLATLSDLTAINGKSGDPPKLAAISAIGILFGMRLNWLFPAMGALDTAYTEIEVSPDGVSNIAQLGLFAYPTTTHTIQGMQPNLTQKYRGRLIDRIGNIGDWSEWATGTTSADASAVLDLLSEKITETQLHQDLQTKIDHIETIDAEIGPIRQDIQNTKDQISQEIIDRQHAIQNAEDGLTQKINDSEEGLLEVIETAKQSTEDGFAAVQSEIEIVADDLKLTAEKTDGVYAQINPPLIGSESDLIGSDQGFAGTWSLQSAMIEGDLALSKRIDTTVAQVNDVQAFAQQEVIARVEGQKATVEKIDTYIAENDTAVASVRDSAKIAVDKSNANAELIQSLELDLNGKASTGQLTQVKSDIEADYNGKITAQTDRIDGVYAQVNPKLIGSESDLIGSDQGYAGVWSEQSARIEADLAQAIRTDTVQTELNGNKAAVEEVTQSVNGLYAQKYIKLGVGNKLAGWGGANDGVESQFIFNFDSIAIGSGDSVGYYPFIFRTTPFTDPITGTVFPVSAYFKAAMFDYQSVKTSHIEDLAVKAAKIADLAVTRGKIDLLAVGTGQIDNLAVDTLKIKDNAVTVPVSAFAEANQIVGTEYTTIQTLNVPSDMGHTILTFGAVFSFATYASSQQILCRVLKNGSVVFDNLEVYFTDYESVGVTSGNSGSHGHAVSVSVSGSASDAGNHNHTFSGNTQNSSAGSVQNSNHNHGYSGTTGSNGSHSHNLNLTATAATGLDGIHSHTVQVKGSARGAGTLNLSRHDSTLIAGTFQLQLKAAGGNINVSQRYIHAMTMRK